MALRLTFLGTRGGIRAKSRLHRRHSALLVQSGRTSVMIDRGRDWLRRPSRLLPQATLLTHTHADHAGGLAEGSVEPVFATAETLAAIARYSIRDPRPIAPRTPFRIGGILFEAFPVEHSLNAPAVGFRISDGRSSLFYVPDVAALPDLPSALGGVALFIGDGASLLRPILKRRGDHLIGHASIGMQLGWCRQAGVTRAVFTHCGSGIVASDGRRSGALVRRLGRESGIAAALAHDGMTLSLP